MNNHFALAPEEYKRHLDPLGDYIKLQTFYICTMTGKPLSQVEEFVKSSISKTGSYPVNNREVRYFSREEQRDRKRKLGNILDYMYSVVAKNLIMTPSWTVYVPESTSRSLYIDLIENKTSVRSHYKKLMFLAEQKNDEPAIKFNNEMQSSTKIGINALSGAASMAASLNHTASLHPSLTSTCAGATGYANLNNERLIMGNRPYLTYQLAFDNLTAICICADFDSLQKAMDEYNLYYPTADDVIDVITYSSDLYWLDPPKIEHLREYAQKLSPIQRAAFVYSGDLYHTDKFNPTIVEAFIRGFGNRHLGEMSLEEAAVFDKNSDGDTSTLAKLICSDYLMGTNLSELKDEHPDRYIEVCYNIKKLYEHMDKYEIFIKGILRPMFLSPNVNIPGMHSFLRRTVLTSDTDSTIFTTQYWVKRIAGNIGFTQAHNCVGYTMAFLVNKTVFHQLALYSKNLGFELKNIHAISMKNEFYFPVYVVTAGTKHYFAYKSVREGNVYTKMKLEKKGVNLRNAKIPKNVMQRFDEFIQSMMDKIIEKQEITLDELFEIPYAVETEIKESILRGESKYFQTAQLKTATSYIKGDDSPAMQYYRLWNHVFAPKYGDSPPLPYTALKVSLKLDNKTQLQAWVDSIEDKELQSRLISFIKNESRTSLKVIYIPKATLGDKPIPKEILSVIDHDSQIVNVTSPFYWALESFGFYLRNAANTKMIYNFYNNDYASNSYLPA